MKLNVIQLQTDDGGFYPVVENIVALKPISPTGTQILMKGGHIEEVLQDCQEIFELIYTIPQEEKMV